MSVRKGSISVPSSPKQLTAASSMPELSLLGLAPLPPPPSPRFKLQRRPSISRSEQHHGAFTSSPHDALSHPQPLQQHEAKFTKPALAALQLPRRSKPDKSALPTLHEPSALSALHPSAAPHAAPATPAKSPRRFRFSLRHLSQRVSRRQSGVPSGLLDELDGSSSMPSSPLFSPPVSPSPRRSTFRKGGTLRLSREQGRSSTAPLPPLPFSERSSSDVFTSACSTPRISGVTHATPASSFLDMGVGDGELLWAEEGVEASYARSPYGAESSRQPASRAKRLLSKWLPRSSSDRSVDSFAAQTLPALPGTSRPAMPWTAQTAAQMSHFFSGGGAGGTRSASADSIAPGRPSMAAREKRSDSSEACWRSPAPRRSSGSRRLAASPPHAALPASPSIAGFFPVSAGASNSLSSPAPSASQPRLSLSRSLRRRSKPKRAPSSESSSEYPNSHSRAFENAVVCRSPFDVRTPLPDTPAAPLPPLPLPPLPLAVSNAAPAAASPARPIAPLIETTRPAIHPWSTVCTPAASPAPSRASVSPRSRGACSSSSSVASGTGSADSDLLGAAHRRMLSPTPDFSAGQPLLLSPLSLSHSRVSLLPPRCSSDDDDSAHSPSPRREETLRASSELHRTASAGTSSFISLPRGGLECASTRSSAALDPFVYATYASNCAAAAASQEALGGGEEGKEMLRADAGTPAAESSEEEELGSLADFRTMHSWHSAREVQSLR